ncbi:MAG: hypothetical protein MUC97_14905 [Bernardetiaceae bacterium]|nr:hypothetical protein [Bernardetiaceae bacterium]
MKTNVNIAVFGCGFWSQFQIGGWLELPGVQIVALYNRTLARAQERAARWWNWPPATAST